MNSFRQIHLDLSLQDIAQAEPNLKINVRPRLEYGNRSRGYRFRVNSSGSISAFSAYYRGTYPLHTYNKLISVDGEPVVLDIKLTKWKLAKPKVRERDGVTSKTVGLNWFLKKEMYGERLEPIRDYFNHDIGYVVVVPSDEFNKCTNTDVFRDFYDDGGLVVPFYADRAGFKHEVARKVKDFRLKLKCDEIKDKSKVGVAEVR